MAPSTSGWMLTEVTVKIYYVSETKITEWSYLPNRLRPRMVARIRCCTHGTVPRTQTGDSTALVACHIQRVDRSVEQLPGQTD